MKILLLLLFLLLCSWWDVKTYRIPNGLIMAAACAGIFLRITGEGTACIWDLLAGVLIPTAACGLLFFFSMVGAGDVKMLMVIGIFLGRAAILSAMWYALLAAAVVALIRIRRQQTALFRFRYLLDYAKRIRAGGPLPAYISEEEIAGRSSWLMHLAVPISLGTALQLLSQLLR